MSCIVCDENASFCACRELSASHAFITRQVHESVIRAFDLLALTVNVTVNTIDFGSPWLTGANKEISVHA
jgi:hypothetical protein